MRSGVVLCGFLAALCGGCERGSTSGDEHTSKTKKKKKKKGSEAPEKGRPGLALKPLKGVPIEIGELTARPTISLLDGVEDVRFPGETGDKYNSLEVQFTVRARKKIPKGAKLIVRNACQFLEHVVVDEREHEPRPEGKNEGVALRGLKKGKRARGSSTSRPTAPELLKAKACEVTFFYEKGDDRFDLGHVCATGGTRIKRRACAEDELKRPQPQSEPITASEPIGRVAHEGAAAWVLLTANQKLGKAKPFSQIQCKESGSQSLRRADHDVDMAFLDPGESVQVAFGVSNLKWLTRENGKCEINLGTVGSTTNLGTWCLTQGRTSVGKCKW